MSESNTKQMIQLNHVKFGYSDTEVLEEINLTIHEGEYVVLTGENGSGKSTLMRLILGEMKPDEGEIILMNNDPRLKKRIGYVSQNGISKNQSFPATVEEIMITGLYQELGLFHLPHKKHKNKIKETLRDFGMEEFLKRRIGELSGGQQQRVMIARAMIGDPKLLILDEPTTGVDARSTKILYDMLYEINTKYNTTIFMITHGRLQECKGCDRILRMDEGSWKNDRDVTIRIYAACIYYRNLTGRDRTIDRNHDRLKENVHDRRCTLSCIPGRCCSGLVIRNQSDLRSNGDLPVCSPGSRSDPKKDSKIF